MTMDAVFATIVAGGWALIQLNIRLILLSHWWLLGLSATQMGGQSPAGSKLKLVPNVEYVDGFKHGFLGHMKTR